MLNDAWAPHGFSFNLLNATYTQNATWSNANFDGWPDMKRALRQGGYGTLNLYTTLLTEGSGLLGVCYLPTRKYLGSLQSGFRSSTMCITRANEYQPYRSAHRLATTTTVPMISCRTAWLYKPILFQVVLVHISRHSQKGTPRAVLLVMK